MTMEAVKAADEMQAYECFRIAREGGVARLTLSRPEKRNSMTPAFWTELPQAVTALSNAGDVRALVIDAEGPHFTAGMDISVFAGGGLVTDAPGQRDAFMRGARALQDTFTALENARFPVIAAIQGGCIGGGVDMVTACDIRLAAPDTVFRIEEINIGMMADVGTLQRLPKLIPEGAARQLAYTGETLTAERAERLGLVNEILPDHDGLRRRAMEMAQTIASKAPLAVAGSKHALNYARDHSTADALAYAMTLQASIWSPQDIQEAIKARGEKRAGAFQDLNEVGVFTKP